MRRGVAFLVLAVLVAGAAVARGRLADLEPSRGPGEDLLYLPNGKSIKALSFGQAPLLASAIYLWAIQFYSNYDRADRFLYVEHVFGDVIAELDPHYVDPYWLGALILTVEAGDVERGLRLLDRGFAANPAQWILPYLAGHECNRVRDYLRAADYFRQAAAAPGAPPHIQRLRAGMVARAGDLRGAVREWQSVLDDPRSNETARGIALRQVRDLAVRADLRDLEAAVAAHRERAGRAPRDLEELVSAGILRVIPADPDGRPYAYDAATGGVTSVAGRVLGAP